MELSTNVRLIQKTVDGETFEIQKINDCAWVVFSETQLGAW